MGDRFELLDVEIGAKIVAEGISETNKIGEGKLFFEDFIFDADEDFLLGGTTGEIATYGAMTGTGETKCLFTVDGVFLASLKDGASIIIVFDVFV